MKECSDSAGVSLEINDDDDDEELPQNSLACVQSNEAGKS
jgi:hypothetical protein